jgi:hypothetical protein
MGATAVQRTTRSARAIAKFRMQTGQADCLLSPIYCLLSPAYCLLSPIYCLLSPVYCLLSPIYCLLSPIYCLLSPIYCLLSSITRHPPETIQRFLLALFTRRLHCLDFELPAGVTRIPKQQVRLPSVAQPNVRQPIVAYEQGTSPEFHCRQCRLRRTAR